MSSLRTSPWRATARKPTRSGSPGQVHSRTVSRRVNTLGFWSTNPVQGFALTSPKRWQPHTPQRIPGMKTMETTTASIGVGATSESAFFLSEPLAAMEARMRLPLVRDVHHGANKSNWLVPNMRMMDIRHVPVMSVRVLRGYLGRSVTFATCSIGSV